MIQLFKWLIESSTWVKNYLVNGRNNKKKIVTFIELWIETVINRSGLFPTLISSVTSKAENNYRVANERDNFSMLFCFLFPVARLFLEAIWESFSRKMQAYRCVLISAVVYSVVRVKKVKILSLWKLIKCD